MDTNLNPGMYIENWIILDEKPEPKNQRHILHIDWVPFLAIKRTIYKIFKRTFTGNS
jgi:hypothetical protein